MKPKHSLIAAIDIGTTKIVTIVGRVNERGKIDIVARNKQESSGVRRGIVMNIEDTASSIRKTIEEVERVVGEKLSHVFVGIAGQYIRSLKNRGYINRPDAEKDISKDEIARLIEEQFHATNIEPGEKILHVLPQSFIVDNEFGLTNPIGMVGRRVEGNFHIVVGKEDSARNIERCVERCGLKINTLILEPLASAAAVLSEDEKEVGVVLMDIGGGTTDLAMFYENMVCHTAVIPFGGETITRDIKEGCTILPKQAEALKMQFGSAMGDFAPEDRYVTIPGINGREPKEISCKNLAYIIQSRMEEILEVVNFEIENSGYADKMGAGIVLTGGGAMLTNLSHLVRYHTGLDVRIGRPVEHLTAESVKEIDHPLYATAVGLLIEGHKWLLDHPLAHSTTQETLKTQVVDSSEMPEEESKSTSSIKIKVNGWRDKLLNLFEEQEDSLIK